MAVHYVRGASTMGKLLACLLEVFIFFAATNCFAVKLKSNLWIWTKTTKELFDNSPSVAMKERFPGTIDISTTTIRVVAHNMEPYIISQPNSSYLDGYLGDLWRILENVLRFKSNVTSISDFVEGTEMIKRNEADIYLAALVYTRNATNMYFSQPYFRNWYHLYFKLPEGKPASYLHFEAFSYQLWSYLFMFFALFTITIWLTCFTLKKFVSNAEALPSMPTCFLGVISAFLNTGYNLKLKSYSARLQIFIALVFGVLCYYALSASLVASLAVLDRPMPFKALKELSDQNVYSLCMRNTSFVYDNFTASDDKGNKTVLAKWQGVVNTNKCPSNMTQWASIRDGLCRGNVVILENRIVMALALQRVECPVAMLPQRYYDNGNYIAISKKFKEKKAVIVMMMRIWSSGVARKLESKWVKRDIPAVTFMGQANQITFSHIEGLVSIYLALIGSSLLLLLAEICFDKMSGRFFKTGQQSSSETKDEVWYFK